MPHARRTIFERLCDEWTALRVVTRAIAKDPGYVSMCVCSLALAVGASTAVFSLAKAVWLRPVSLRAPNRVIMLYDGVTGGREYRFWQDVQPLHQPTVFLARSAA